MADVNPAREVLGQTCADGGKCHHECTNECYRRVCCAPLSGVFPNDEWPADAPTYTREQWGEIMAIERCQREGHDYEILKAITMRGEQPQRLLCNRCGVSWKVTPA